MLKQARNFFKIFFCVGIQSTTNHKKSYARPYCPDLQFGKLSLIVILECECHRNLVLYLVIFVKMILRYAVRIMLDLKDGKMAKLVVETK